MLHLLESVAGLLLVLAVFVDVFSSVLVPRASPRSFRIGPALSRVAAPLWHRVATRMPSPRLRQSMRASLAPALLIMTLGSWILALTLGFALLLHAEPQNIRVDHFAFSDAMFQAALAISTLGLLQADVLGGARAVVALAGLSGFTVLTLVVAFLLSLQAALHRREALVLQLDARAGRPPSARMLVTTLGGSTDDTLARFFAEWEAWTAEVEQGHLAYPVLFRFRSLHENSEWLACLGAVLDFGALLRAAEPAAYPEAIRAAGFLAITAARATHEFSRVLRPAPQPVPRDGGEDRPLAALLARHGMAPTTPASFPERLRALRADHAAHLPRIADRLDIAWPDTLLGNAGL